MANFFNNTSSDNFFLKQTGGATYICEPKKNVGSNLLFLDVDSKSYGCMNNADTCKTLNFVEYEFCYDINDINTTIPTNKVWNWISSDFLDDEGEVVWTELGPRRAVRAAVAAVAEFRQEFITRSK